MLERRESASHICRVLLLFALGVLAAARCSPTADDASTTTDANAPVVGGGSTAPDEHAVARRVVVSFSEGLAVRVEGSGFAITRNDGSKLSADQASAAAALNQRVTRAGPMDVAPTHRPETLGGEVPEVMRRSFDIALPPDVSEAEARQLAEALSASSLVEEAWLASVGEAPGAETPGAP
jgi:hypothetical protein